MILILPRYSERWTTIRDLSFSISMITTWSSPLWPPTTLIRSTDKQIRLGGDLNKN